MDSVLDTPFESINPDVVDPFVRFILSRYKQIEVRSFYILLFLSEYECKIQTGDRITESDYEIVLDGCVSDEIQSYISELDNIKKESIPTANGPMSVYVSTLKYDSGVPKETEKILQNIIERYGTKNSDELSQLFLQVVPRKFSIGQKIDFQKVTQM